MTTYFPQTLIFYGGGGLFFCNLSPSCLLIKFILRDFIFICINVFIFAYLCICVAPHDSDSADLFVSIVIILIISSHTIITILTF